MAHALRYLIKGPATGDRGPKVFSFAAVRGWQVLVLWLGFAAIAEAQPAGLASVRFTVFSARPIADVAFAPRAGAAPQKVVFYPTARSPRYEFRGAMPLR